MLKSRIARKLTRNFAIVLVLFSFLVGSVFFFLFRSYMIEVNKRELEKDAQALATILSDEGTLSFRKGMGGYGSVIRFIGNVSDTTVWIVDEDMRYMTMGRGQSTLRDSFTLPHLPSDAKDVIQEVFKGKTVFSEGFSNVLSALTLTVGVPVQNEDGTVLGVVLLHSPVDGTVAAVQRGLVVLAVSVLVALMASFALSLLISASFTKPLSKMKLAANAMMQGDYTIRCDVRQKDEIGELSADLDLLAIRLEEASKESEKLEGMRRDFVANISHELRTPVTVIRGSLEALCDKIVDTPEKVEEYHKQMLKESKFLERLIMDLLDLSRLQNTNFAIEMAAVNPCDVIEDVARSASRIAQNKGVTIRTQFSDPCMQVQGDYGRMRQMFMIVLDNAIKFSPEGALVEIEVTPHKVIICDHGCGIDPAHLPYIFDRFYKTHGELNKSGTGLGLAIAKQIADRHCITLSAENNIEGGAKFIFEFPNFECN